MEHHTACLAIGGDISHVIVKEFVTPAEIVLLRQIHGDHAVTNIRPTGAFDHDGDAERNLLGEIYDDATVEQVFGKYGDVPASLAAAKIEDSYMDQVWLTQNKAKPKKAAKKAATKKRARTEAGHFVADDPTTDANEAFVEE